MQEATTTEKSGIRARVQRFGSFLSGMIMPNIGAFIAWGLITALFIPTGWWPNERLAELVGPMITYLLPLLIGFTGGRMVFGIRGGVVGAVATMGVIVGADIPMFLGAMVMGPLGGYVIKKIDEALDGHIPQGFEMLINNFTAGISAAALAIVGLLGVGPVVLGLTGLLSSGVEALVNAGLLPLLSLFIEPGKVLFLNNAINQGILTPLGAEQAADAGKSILFLLETNPGPGLGILLAYMIFGKGMARQSAPGATIIHFFGGIHEIYFPYILMKPVLLLAVIAGGASGIFTFSLFDAGLRSVPSPGSIIALLALTPQGNFAGVILGVLVATIVSFVIASLFLRLSKASDEEDLGEATAKMEAMKGKKSQASAHLSAASSGTAITEKSQEITKENVRKIIFACDAGMGSSAMGASLLKNKMKKEGLSFDVSNTAINQIPDDADLVITHKDLTERAKAKKPDAIHVSVENFLSSPKYDEIIQDLKK
ncbi:PTS mannitol transporter subunit IICB [Jeotgalibacillus soli]|uniref:PTS system mannitol-specific EIICB component n=1 Tax=Jeotgalibacillus soli TaxID=889306 RepID=A0A0C2W6G3_9BACL|nr:PTS mannitol transporter subunit IICB [Jeotgalibacillus soli]KIL52166.1 PTS mannitol transporter subunit IIB [Jeotgalibacillus soli]